MIWSWLTGEERDEGRGGGNTWYTEDKRTAKYSRLRGGRVGRRVADTIETTTVGLLLRIFCSSRSGRPEIRAWESAPCVGVASGPAEVSNRLHRSGSKEA